MYLKISNSAPATRIKLGVKWKIYFAIMLQILLLHMPLGPKFHLSILGSIMISIFFFATWESMLTYKELIIFGFLKDLISGNNIGCSAAEFVIMLSIGDIIRRLTSDRSITIALISFIFSVCVVSTFHSIILSAVYKQIVFSAKYWQFVVLYPTLFYVPLHVILTKYTGTRNA